MWWAYASGACLSSATLVLLLKAMGEQLRPATVTLQQGAAIASAVLLGAGLLGAVLLCLLPRSVRQPLRKMSGKLVAAAAAIVVTQMLLVAAVNGAPNPGFAHLVVNFNMVVVTIAAIFLFGSRLGAQAAIGMLVAVAGLALVLCS